MKFTSDQFANLFGSLRHLQPASFSNDKRTAPRINYHGEVVLWLIDPDGHPEPITAEVKNFSARGIGLIHCNKMPIGAEFLTMIPRKGDKPAPLLCRVTRITEWGKRQFLIGAEFVCLLPPKTAPASHQDIQSLRNAILD